MATTKIWQIKDNIKRVIGYAENPEKTEYRDLAQTIRYAVNEDKTVQEEGEEKELLVTTINCDGEPAAAMLELQRAFHKVDGNVAYHAYQSFAPGEVTPELCHEIGVLLAKELWSKDYQVVVATHMDKPTHLHNHFVINSVSFRNGKKFDCDKSVYWKMREVSDRLCRWYGLSVIRNAQSKTPRAIYEAEKKGLATRYTLMKQALDEVLEVATSYDEFELLLHDRGYAFYRNDGHKYATMRRLSEADRKPTRIIHFGEEYDLAMIDRRLIENSRKDIWHSYTDYYTDRAIANGHYDVHSHFDEHYKRLMKMPPLFALICSFVYLLGGPDFIEPERHRPRYQPVTPEMREAARKCEMYSREARIMARENLGTKEDVDRYLDRLEEKIVELELKRQKLYNSIRKCRDEEKVATVREEIHAISKELSPLRREKKDLADLLERSGVIRELVKAEEQARRERIARECQLSPEERAYLGVHTTPEQTLIILQRARQKPENKPTEPPAPVEEPKPEQEQEESVPHISVKKKKKDDLEL